ncbi:MAG: hypothetical protein A2Z72_08360 [Omnitrophica bacterium RBG_13_46_9]|nr:MAG: hypothetical protein A2Z72_08360 [Omnitrophica bacterium RBG_13_46_9]
MINAGIVGCGNIAWKWDYPKGKYFNTHAKSYYKNPDSNLTCCCDPDMKKAEGLAKTYNVKSFYKDYKEMLSRESLDVVSVCSPAVTHYEILAHILKHTGIKYILAEKPLTLNAGQTKRIVSLAKKKNVYISVNYLRRWDETTKKLREYIASNNFGQFQLGTIVYYSGFKENGAHFIDLLNFLGLKLYFDSVLSVSRIKGNKHDFGASLAFKTQDKKPLYFYWVDKENYRCLEVNLFYKKARVRIGDYSEVDIFQLKKAKAYPDIKKLALKRHLPSTICSSMRNSVKDIVKRCKENKVSYEALEREQEFMELISYIDKKVS